MIPMIPMMLRQFGIDCVGTLKYAIAPFKPSSCTLHDCLLRHCLLLLAHPAYLNPYSMKQWKTGGVQEVIGMQASLRKHWLWIDNDCCLGLRPRWFPESSFNERMGRQMPQTVAVMALLLPTSSHWMRRMNKASLVYQFMEAITLVNNRNSRTDARN